jgi:branched-subunit amino acid ABC-type transport system permease component
MTPADPGELSFFLSVLVEGVLSGAIYALIALAFVPPAVFGTPD